MRILIWGIVGLSGLGFAVHALGVHGSTDERAAIRRAVRAPFADLRHHDARELCEDFVPSVAAHLSSDPGGCPAAVAALFALGTHDAEYVAAEDRPAQGRRLQVGSIDWRGRSASADLIEAGRRSDRRRWQLRMVGRRWRLVTPARLQMRSDCRHHPFGVPGCIDALSLQFAGG
ncbi:MAG TPA: hypothetical protein VHW67_13320 [Solirubrobacteraceae bacterium]|jgi:hypothetical protein|nr:hypothetical protein [Solirubrobacteraceae bacterium]